MNIALFDFDGTITDADMYTKFLYYSGTWRRALLSKFVLLPFYVLYKAGLLSAPKMRSIASFVAFVGRDADEVAKVGERYAKEVVPKFLRRRAVERLNWHKNNGDQVVIVSASLDVYLRPWCKLHGYALVCSELEVCRGKYSGLYVNGDCSYVNKPKRTSLKFDLSQYQSIFAYGDTKADLPMLKLANEAYLDWEKYSPTETP